MIVRWSMMLMRAGRRLDARRTSGRNLALPPRERRGPRGERTPSTKEGDLGGLVVRFRARMADLSGWPELSSTSPPGTAGLSLVSWPAVPGGDITGDVI